MVSLSVVIPAFKRIEQTIRTISLLFQSEGVGTYYDLEIIVADSTPDDSLKNTLAAHDSRVHYIRPLRPGVAENKNAGASHAKGQILVFCDSDMEVAPETLMCTVDALKKHARAAAVTGTIYWQGGPKDSKYDQPKEGAQMKIVGDTTYVQAIYSRYMATYKKVFDDVGGYDVEIFNMRGEGSDLSTRYWRSGYPLVYDSSIIVHHIHDAPDSVATRVPYPEYDIAKDHVLLAIKYDMVKSTYPLFYHDTALNFKKYGDEGYGKIIHGIASHAKELSVAIPKLLARPVDDKPLYDFTYLEVFSHDEACMKCISEAEQRLMFTRDYFN